MKHTFTQGPWEVIGYAHIYGPDEAVRRPIAQLNTSRPVQVNKANARLIAAAPDLLEALQTILDRYVTLVDSGDCYNGDSATEAEVIRARAAIARARGE